MFPPPAPVSNTISRSTHFRTFTVILAWLLIVTAFFESPEVLTGAQRLIQHGIETVRDNIPAPGVPVSSSSSGKLAA